MAIITADSRRRDRRTALQRAHHRRFPRPLLLAALILPLAGGALAASGAHLGTTASTPVAGQGQLPLPQHPNQAMAPSLLLTPATPHLQEPPDEFTPVARSTPAAYRTANPSEAAALAASASASATPTATRTVTPSATATPHP